MVSQLSVKTNQYRKIYVNHTTPITIRLAILVDVETRLDELSCVSQKFLSSKLMSRAMSRGVAGSSKTLTTQMPMILLELLAADIRGHRAARSFSGEWLHGTQQTGYANRSFGNLPGLRWVNHLILGMDILVGADSRCLVKLDTSYLKSKNYEAIFVRC